MRGILCVCSRTLAVRQGVLLTACPRLLSKIDSMRRPTAIDPPDQDNTGQIPEREDSFHKPLAQAAPSQIKPGLL